MTKFGCCSQESPDNPAPHSQWNHYRLQFQHLASSTLSRRTPPHPLHRTTPPPPPPLAPQLHALKSKSPAPPHRAARCTWASPFLYPSNPFPAALATTAILEIHRLRPHLVPTRSTALTTASRPSRRRLRRACRSTFPVTLLKSSFSRSRRCTCAPSRCLSCLRHLRILGRGWRRKDGKGRCIHWEGGLEWDWEGGGGVWGIMWVRWCWWRD